MYEQGQALLAGEGDDFPVDFDAGRAEGLPGLRRALPWVALSGALLLLLCDIVGRLIYFPYEVPVGTITGLVGSAGFLVLLARRHARG